MLVTLPGPISVLVMKASVTAHGVELTMLNYRINHSVPADIAVADLVFALIFSVECFKNHRSALLASWFDGAWPSA